MVLKKISYVPIASDIIHSGHLNIIKHAKKYGDVIIGLLSDEAISQYRDFPILNYSERYNFVSKISGINKIIKQNDWDYKLTLKKIKPDYFVHGDDWKKGNLSHVRKFVINEMKSWGGKIIEVPFTKNISKKLIKDKIDLNLSISSRVSLLKRMLIIRKKLIGIEAHNGLSAHIIENIKLNEKNKTKVFDLLWSSSLTDSTIRAMPDNQSVDYSIMINGLNEITNISSKPIIFDADNGGKIEHLPYLVKSLEKSGVSAIVLEDKIGLKINSLFADQSKSKQDTIKNFSKKIKVACDSRISKDFMIFARIESLILGTGMQDAILRSKNYVKSGADGIFIHSKKKDSKEILDFLKKFREFSKDTTVMVVPSTYSFTREEKLFLGGANIVVYANQLLRSAHKAMEETASQILKSGRAYEADKNISSIKKIIKLIR